MKTKPKYHQSTLINYYTCPYKMVLSQQYSIEQTDAMRNGLLFEYFVFGMNPRAAKVFNSAKDYESSLIGKKSPLTIERIKSHAESCKQIFVGGSSFVTLEFEDKEYINAGECDYLGDVNLKGNIITCIADLKYTSNIASWKFLNKASDYFQALYYSYIIWKNTKRALPFLYIVVDSTFDEPVIGYKLIRFNKQNYKQLKRDVDFIHNDILKAPKVGYDTCIKGAYNKPCDYLQYCEAGRELIENSFEIDYDDLIPDFVNPIDK